ncbi:hypothetical protein PoB_005169900 [Plakobranchus ocellatus]|uniref:Granulins domain-containing protein n=1 Tax=Plakobranchus ocellatus TaxID=259542 RepID=A0AAV4C245_9GAST|nr:hypothetical protein PoB_005169900 [Plakobranchus ocellatus]
MSCPGDVGCLEERHCCSGGSNSSCNGIGPSRTTHIDKLSYTSLEDKECPNILACYQTAGLRKWQYPRKVTEAVVELGLFGQCCPYLRQ